MRTIRTIAIGLLLTSLSVGCFGGGATVKTTTSTVSVGQQLIDLKSARDSGAMTQAQYDKAKKELIEHTLEN
jgi:hypothetical protein